MVVAATAEAGISRELAAVASGHGTRRDAADAGIVMVEMLLSMVVGVAAKAATIRRALDSRHITRGEGLLELGRSS